MQLLGIRSKPRWDIASTGAAFSPLKRPLAIALPFLKMHPVTKTAAVVGSKLHSCAVTVVDLRQLWLQGKYHAISYPLLKSIVSSIAVVSLVFDHPALQGIGIAGGIASNIHQLVTALHKADAHAIGAALWALAGTALAISTLICAAPEIILMYMLHIAFTELSKSLQEYGDGRAPEALARLAIAFIFAHQARVPYEEMRRKWQTAEVNG